MSSTAFAEWLSERMQRRGLNQSQVAAYAGVHPSSVNAWLKGSSFPSTRSCRRLAEVFGVPVAEVYNLAGHGTPDYVPPPRQELSPVERMLEAISEMPLPVPVVEQLASAGEGQGAVIETLWVPPTATGGRRPNLLGLRVRGTSMEPEVHDGDTVIIDRDATPKPGDVVVASVGDDVFVKRLERKSDGRLVLRGNNGRLVPADEALVAGVVIQAVRDIRRRA